MHEHLRDIIEFLQGIGLTVVQRSIPGNTFLPGIRVESGTLQVDIDRLKFPGDLLHEAGHLALLSPPQRHGWSGDFTDAGGYEMGAIAWSYAACCHLGLAPEVVFHAGGYLGDSDWLVELFTLGPGLGVTILEWKGLTRSSGDQAFPSMQHWLCIQQ